jgi:hypothetical protein
MVRGGPWRVEALAANGPVKGAGKKAEDPLIACKKGKRRIARAHGKQTSLNLGEKLTIRSGE